MDPSLEDFLRMTSQLGIPAPAQATPPTLAASPTAPPPPAWGMPPASTLPPAPPLAGLTAPRVPPTDGTPPPFGGPAHPPATGGFAPAAFTPPDRIAADEGGLFGDYLSTLAQGRPEAAAPPVLPQGGPPPGIFPGDQLPGFPQQAPPSRQLPAAPGSVGQMPAYAQPAPVPPGLARRYPGATRMAQLLGAARARRGF